MEQTKSHTGDAIENGYIGFLQSCEQIIQFKSGTCYLDARGELLGYTHSLLKKFTAMGIVAGSLVFCTTPEECQSKPDSFALSK